MEPVAVILLLTLAYQYRYNDFFIPHKNPPYAFWDITHITHKEEKGDKIFYFFSIPAAIFQSSSASIEPKTAKKQPSRSKHTKLTSSFIMK